MPRRAPWRVTATGLRLYVRVTPRAGRDRLVGLIDLPGGPAMQISVVAPPEGGSANAAVCQQLAGFFRVAKSDVTVVAGAKARDKQIAIAGDGAALAAVIDAWAARNSC